MEDDMDEIRTPKLNKANLKNAQKSLGIKMRRKKTTDWAAMLDSPELVNEPLTPAGNNNKDLL